MISRSGSRVGLSSTARRYGTAALSVVGLLFFTNWPTYQFIVLGGLVPLIYYLAAMGLAGVLVWLQPRSLMLLLREPLFYWFAFYAVSGLLWVVFGEGYLDPENREWRLRFLLLLLFSAGLVLSSAADSHKFAWAILAALIFAAFTYWHDFLNPFLYVPHDVPGSNPGRGAGLFINANQAGNALVAMGIASMPFVGGQWRVLLLIMVLLGVVPTFSRSSILFAVMVAGGWLWHGQLRRSTLLILLVAIPVAAVMGYQLFSAGIKSSEINLDNVMGRVGFFLNLGEADDASASERELVAIRGWEKFSGHPLAGIGVGVTDAGAGSAWGYRVSTHNMFLRLMVEQGILGGVLYLSFLGLIFTRGVRLARNRLNPRARNIGVALLLMVLYFSFIGLFSHTLLQEPVSILTLAFLLAAARQAETNSV